MKHAVSVVIYTHNDAEHITKAAKAILERDNNSIELIIVDDASTDKTVAVVGMLSLQERYRELVHVISHIEKEGKLTSWADGVKAAHGEYVFCMSASDYLRTEELNKLYQVASQKNADIAVPTLKFSEHPHENPSTIEKIIPPPSLETYQANISRSLFAGDYFEPHITGWLFQRDLLLHSFAEIERYELSKIDEMGIVFIASTKADCLLSFPDSSPLITTTIFSIHAKQTEIFEYLCFQNKTLTVCKTFLLSNRIYDHEKSAYEGLSFKLCTRVCRLFPTQVPAEFWKTGAELLLNCWGAEAIASSYARLPQVSLSEVAIALATGLPRSKGKKIERVMLLVQDQNELLDALAYSDKLVKNKKTINFIIEEGVHVSPGMPIAEKLDSQIFSSKRAERLRKAFETYQTDALVVFGHERRFAFDMLLARSLDIQVGFVTNNSPFSPQRFLELLPQAAFANVVVTENDVEAKLWELIDVEISSLSSLAYSLSQKARGNKYLASRKLILTFSRLAFGYLQKTSLLQDFDEKNKAFYSQLQKDIQTLTEKNAKLKRKLMQAQQERDEYKNFYEGKISRRIVQKRLEKLK